MNKRFKKSAETAIYYILNDPIRVMSMIILVMIIFNLLTSWDLYFDKEQDFIINLLAETHGLVLDILVLGIFVVLINRAVDRKKTVSSCIQEIEDMKSVKDSDYAHLRVIRNIKVLNSCKVYELDLMGANISNSKLVGVNLVGSNMVLIDATGTNLSGADLTDTRIAQGDFSSAIMERVILDNCYGKDSIFKDAALSRASFKNAKLLGADFSDARLHNASFNGASLTGADFYGAELFETDFRGCAHLTGAQIVAAKLVVRCKFDERLEETVKNLLAAKLEIVSTSEGFLKATQTPQQSQAQTV